MMDYKEFCEEWVIINEGSYMTRKDYYKKYFKPGNLDLFYTAIGGKL